MLGFFITRHVTSAETNLYWLECCSKIRKFYPHAWIIIIDDGSNADFLSTDVFPQCIILKSEFPRRGELLPYYYFLKFTGFDTAVILHDSAFVQTAVPFETFINRPLWSFRRPLHHDKALEVKLLKSLTNSEELVARHASGNWSGCFGVMSVMTRDFLQELETRYSLSNLLQAVTTRLHRCCLERVFGVIFAVHSRPDSIFGSIHQNQYMLRFPQYVKLRQRKAVEKVWTGR